MECAGKRSGQAGVQRRAIRPFYCRRLPPVALNASKNGGGVHLSSREFTLLQALLEELNRVFSRAELEQRLYKRGEAIRSKAVEVHVHYLRRKVGNDEIITIRGNSYRLRMLAWKSSSV
ncbi:MAG TPA: winged helix-turn-helix domain-containing protein [Caballeronia sp.]|nr:winged helix-turn-helix domain-containing protein [Caballeronia sp.]